MARRGSFRQPETHALSLRCVNYRNEVAIKAGSLYRFLQLTVWGSASQPFLTSDCLIQCCPPGIHLTSIERSDSVVTGLTRVSLNPDD